MSNIVYCKCGNTKFEVYLNDGLTVLRCFHCDSTLDEVLEHNGIMIKGVNKE